MVRVIFMSGIRDGAIGATIDDTSLLMSVAGATIAFIYLDCPW